MRTTPARDELIKPTASVSFVSTEAEYWIWPLFRDGSRPPYDASRTRLRSSENPPRPYIWRFDHLDPVDVAFNHARVRGRRLAAISGLRNDLAGSVW
jgi:hypothetical protein